VGVSNILSGRSTFWVVAFTYVMVSRRCVLAYPKAVVDLAIVLSHKGKNAAEQRELTEVRSKAAPEIGSRAAFNTEEPEYVVYNMMNRNYDVQHDLLVKIPVLSRPVNPYTILDSQRPSAGNTLLTALDPLIYRLLVSAIFTNTGYDVFWQDRNVSIAQKFSHSDSPPDGLH
jgi:hypothetical protein